jgi:ankyrin repeat protein
MRFVLFALFAFLATSAGAQTPPSDSELRAYRGLHAAAAAGNAVEIEKLAGAGGKLEDKDGNGRTPLHIAVFMGKRDAARALLRLGANPNALDGQRYDIVTIASVANDVPMLKLAIEGGASAKNITSPYDGTALIAAAHLGHAEIVRTLIAAGAPLDHVNNLGWTALIEAVILGNGGPRHTACVRSLLAAGASKAIADRNGVSALQHAEQRGYRAMVELLR